jgi:hypothetical protein
VSSAITENTMRLYDDYQPPLDGGKYRLALKQTIDVPGKKESFDGLPDQIFWVETPRFHLKPADVHAVYPPPYDSGDFRHDLPHVVLRRREIPWSRKLHFDGFETPWLALLLLSADELEGERPVFRPLKELETAAAVPNKSPEVTLSPWENSDAQVRTLDIPIDTFLNIAPRPGELPLLSHVREVNTGDKEILMQPADGWFSLVIGNRLPQEPGLYHAFLVSLEGLKDWKAWVNLDGSGSTGRVRVVVLASWDFTNEVKPERGSFNTLAEELTAGLLSAAPDANLEPLEADEELTGRRLLEDALLRGYVPLEMINRQGEPTIGWYRGPLLPVELERVDRDPFERPEAALIYDDRTGLFDASYSVAWQLGRLLALSDPTFAIELSQWRFTGRSLHDLYEERREVMDSYAEILNLENLVEDAEDADLSVAQLIQQVVNLLSPDQMSSLLAVFLNRTAQRLASGELQGPAGGRVPQWQPTAEQRAELDSLEGQAKRARLLEMILESIRP